MCRKKAFLTLVCYNKYSGTLECDHPDNLTTLLINFNGHKNSKAFSEAVVHLIDYGCNLKVVYHRCRRYYLEIKIQGLELIGIQFFLGS